MRSDARESEAMTASPDGMSNDSSEGAQVPLHVHRLVDRNNQYGIAAVRADQRFARRAMSISGCVPCELGVRIGYRTILDDVSSSCLTQTGRLAPWEQAAAFWRNFVEQGAAAGIAANTEKLVEKLYDCMGGMNVKRYGVINLF